MNRVRSVLLAGVLTLAIVPHAALAGEVSMAGGRVGFAVPDDWVDIMDAQGTPEMRVYQVPGAGSGTLARVSVMVRPAADYATFQRLRDEARVKARALPGYRASSGDADDGGLVYTAREGATTYHYRERFVFRGNLAVQLRCVRPAHGQPSAWTGAFDRQCTAVADDLAH